VTEARPLVDSVRTVEIHSAAHQVAAQILGLIRDGVLKAGDSLPSEAELATAFGVGRSTIREAKGGLVARGFLESRGKRGTFVASLTGESLDVEMLAQLLSDEAINEIYEARQIVEVGAARLAATRARREDLDELDRLIDSMERALHEDETFWPLTVEFHRQLVRASHNRTLTRLSQVISRLVMVHQMPVYRSIVDKGEALAEHRWLVEVLKTGDPEQAGDALASHLEQSDQRRTGASEPPAEVAGRPKASGSEPVA
jgi:GntR family transcriptional repressor for pyruvate dehydrogenase complex